MVKPGLGDKGRPYGFYLRPFGQFRLVHPFYQLGRYFVARLCVIPVMNLRLSALALLLPLLPLKTLAGPPLLPGQVLFQKNCVRCHGANGKRGLNGAHDLTKSNLNAFGRTYLITSGLGKMPAFGKMLTPAQVQQVVAYSLTLK